MFSYNIEEAIVEEVCRLLDKGQIDLAIARNLISPSTAQLIRKNMMGPKQLSLFSIQYENPGPLFAKVHRRRGSRASGTNPRALGTNPRADKKVP